ncbi:MAG: endonuclease V [Planctomycetaceae bacterium]
MIRNHDLWPAGLPDLKRELSLLLEQIPTRCVTTFGDLAAALGHAQAAVWIAKELATGKYPLGHRVVRITGEVPSRGDEDFTRAAVELVSGGIDIVDGKVDLARYRFGNFNSDQPLAKLKAIQDQLAACIDLRPLRRKLKRIAGLDVSYPDAETAVAACVICDGRSAEVLESFTVTVPVAFPYITGLLSFREIPAYLKVIEAMQQAQADADVWLVDGSGILHHRSAGIATHLGLLLDIPTIGVSKSLLCGSVNLSQLDHTPAAPIVYNGETRGMAIKANPRSRPLYISPGHRISVEHAAEVVRNLFRDHRLPEPTYWADRLSRDQGTSGKED